MHAVFALVAYCLCRIYLSPLLNGCLQMSIVLSSCFNKFNGLCSFLSINLVCPHLSMNSLNVLQTLRFGFLQYCSVKFAQSDMYRGRTYRMLTRPCERWAGVLLHRILCVAEVGSAACFCKTTRRPKKQKTSVLLL